MRYLWEALLAIREAGIPEERIRFAHCRNGSAYMELSLPCLNQEWLDMEDDEGNGVEIEVNTFYRFYGIFKDLFLPDQGEFPELRKSLTNLVLHMLAHNDVLSGMTKEDYHKGLLAAEVEAGGYGEEARNVFLSMKKDERNRLLGGWLKSFRVGNALPIFLDMIHDLVPDGIVYHNNDRPDEILIYTRMPRERYLEQRIGFLVDTFLDIGYHAEVFYEYHFGIIGIDDTMRIDEIAVC